MNNETNFCPQDSLLLGAVGSNEWRGALMEYKNGKIRQIEDPLIGADSYLGIGPIMTHFYIIQLIPPFDTE